MNVVELVSLSIILYAINAGRRHGELDRQHLIYQMVHAVCKCSNLHGLLLPLIEHINKHGPFHVGHVLTKLYKSKSRYEEYDLLDRISDCSIGSRFSIYYVKMFISTTMNNIVQIDCIDYSSVIHLFNSNDHLTYPFGMNLCTNCYGMGHHIEEDGFISGICIKCYGKGLVNWVDNI